MPHTLSTAQDFGTIMDDYCHSDSETFRITRAPTKALLTSRSIPTTLHLDSLQYISSEEEVSPSFDGSSGQTSFTDLEDDELLQTKSIIPPCATETAPDAASVDTISNDDSEDCTLHTAHSMTITNVGPPRLVDIVRLAPMHKRKRNLAMPPRAPPSLSINLRPLPTKRSPSRSSDVVPALSVCTNTQFSTPQNRRLHQRTLSWAKRQEAVHPAKRFGMGFGGMMGLGTRSSRMNRALALPDRLAPSIPRFPFETRSGSSSPLECVT